MSRVYTGGTFDCFHAGHADFLFQCYRLSLRKSMPNFRVVVALNTDEFVEEFKGRRPACTYEERAAVLWACRYVTDVIENTGGADSKPAILSVQPQIIAIGSDWRDRDYHAQMQFTPEWLTEHGIELTYIERQRPLSSTAIKARIRA